MAKYAMVIDLHKCVGCSGCDLACKSENNTPVGINWSHHKIETTGKFPKVQYTYVPTLCNHCDDAPCVRVCPTKAMHKEDETGMTLHDADKCIGCKSCMLACPYDVISFNAKQAFTEWTDQKPFVAKAGNPKALIDALGVPVPFYNPERSKTYEGIRTKGIVEKCTFCDHRVKAGLMPHCVESCPADARIFGDLSDPSSRVSQLVNEYRPSVLKPEKGTHPNVYYIRDYNRAD